MTLPPLSEIRAACEKATPGPWRAAPMSELFPEEWGKRLWKNPLAWGCVHEGKEMWFCRREDAEFKANARTWVPALLERVERLEGALTTILKVGNDIDTPGERTVVRTLEIARRALEGEGR